MKQIHRFRNLPDWEEASKSLRDLGLDEEVISGVGAQEGDSLDLVETCMALEESFSSRFRKRAKS